jgi:hypothetical protein
MRVNTEVVEMRWLALVAYVALVALTWIKGGAQAGLIFLVCVLFLTIAFRPNEAGDALRGWARLLFRWPRSSSASCS